MDDTLFDHSLTCREAIRKVRRERPFLRRRPLDDLWQEYLALLNDPGAPGAPRMVSSELRARRWRLLAASCDEDLSAEEARELSQTYRAFYQSARRPVPGSVALVRRVHRSARVAIVTNNEVAEQEEKLKFLGLGDAVDELVVSEAVGRSKPDPAIFAEALRRVASRPTSAVMLGDSWTNDVLGARGAGVRPVWFNRFGLPRPTGDGAEELRSLRPAAPAEALLLGTERTGPGRTA